MKIHIGCGSKVQEGWLNLDYQRGDVYCDLSYSIPLADSSATHIFHEHFLEHLEYPDEAERFLNECYRILKPSGLMRIGVPDTEYIIRSYFMKDEEVFSECREKWHPAWCTTMIESINYHFRQDGQHKFAYDYETLEKVLSRTGFGYIEKVDFNQAPGFDIDSRDDAGTLFLNCVKK